MVDLSLPSLDMSLPFLDLSLPSLDLPLPFIDVCWFPIGRGLVFSESALFAMWLPLVGFSGHPTEEERLLRVARLFHQVQHGRKYTTLEHRPKLTIIVDGFPRSLEQLEHWG